ncbi:MAG: ASPIC/UnbV domain-containing protein, partial [Acidobacteriota bacterium]
QMEQGEAPFEDRGEELGMSRSGWGWDSRFADFDGDGVPEGYQAVGFLRGEKNRWPELHELAMGNDNHMINLLAWHHFQPGDDLSGHLHDPFWVRASDGRYYDLAPEVGIGQEHISRGIAIGDVDRDGDLDFAVANQWESSWFFRNDSPVRNASLVLDVRLPNANGTTRPAVGAEVKVRKPDGTVMAAEVDGGSGHSGKRAPEVFFGLGPLPLDSSLRVAVRWRDGSGQVRQQEFQLKPGVHTVVLGSATASGKAV